MSYVLALSYFDDDDILQSAWVSNASKSKFIWVPTALHLSPTCFFIRMGEGFLRKTKKSYPDLLISCFAI